VKKSELLQVIKEEIKILSEGHVHHDFGKFMGDLTNSNTIWLYPSSGAYDFKKEIKKLTKAFGKNKVHNREMDSVEIVFDDQIMDERYWWKAIK
jgi:hypothetical protein